MISLTNCVESGGRYLAHYLVNSAEEMLQYVAEQRDMDGSEVEENEEFKVRMVQAK